MKTTQAWTWLAAGVVALGLNGFYQDGGLAKVHSAVDEVVARSTEVIALAWGHEDRFLAKAQIVAAREQTHSCRWATAVARWQTRIARSQAGFSRVEAMTAREEGQLARLEANRARIEARNVHMRLATASFDPSVFDRAKMRVICPRVRVMVPQPSINIDLPDVQFMTAGAGPI